jgi:hypothetical protein
MNLYKTLKIYWVYSFFIRKLESHSSDHLQLLINFSFFDSFI